MKSLAEFIYYASSFLRYLAGLQNEEDTRMVEQGVDCLQGEALGMHTANPSSNGDGPSMLEDEENRKLRRSSRFVSHVWILGTRGD